MKLKIMIIALLLLVGIGSAVNRLPATEFVGDVDMSGNNITDAKMGQSVPQTVIGPYIWCDYVTDGTADEETIHMAIADGKRNLLLTGLIYVSANNSIVLNQSDIHLRSSSKGWEFSDNCQINAAAGTNAPVIVVNATGITIENIYIDGMAPGELVTGAHGIDLIKPARIRHVDIFSAAENGIKFSGVGTSFGNNPIIDVTIWNCTGWGIAIEGNDVQISDSNIGSCGEGSIAISGNGNHIINAHVWPDPAETLPLSSIYITGNGNSVASSNIDTFGWVGIYIDGTADTNTVASTKFFNPMISGGKPIVCSVNTTRSMIFGNTLEDSTGNVTYGVDLGDSGNNTVGFNSLGTITGAGGAGNVIDHNNVL